jgi:hypothetical protein
MAYSESACRADVVRPECPGRALPGAAGLFSRGEQATMPLEPYTPHSRSSRRSSPALATNVVEVWHVAVSWDDIKTMTVDQLDDAFRLDIVDASTSVWKEGMDEWLPLGVIAGLDAADEDDEEEISQVEVVWPMASALPQVPRLPAPSPAPVLRAVPAPAPAPALRPLPAPASRVASIPVPALKATVPGPAASLRPAPAPASRAVASLPPAPVLVATQQSWPPAAAPLRTQEPWAGDYRAPAPDDWATPRGELRRDRDRPTAPPASARVARNTDAPAASGQSVAPSGPVAFTIPPARARRSGGSRFGQWLLGVAFIGGVLVTLYRNDILLDAARSLHVESRYLDAERTLLGGPSFGTPRALDAFRETTPVAAAAAGLDVTSKTDSLADRPAPALVAAPTPAPAAEAPAPIETAHAKEVTSLSALPVDTASAVHTAATPASAVPLAKAVAAQAFAPSSKRASSSSAESPAPKATHAQKAIAASKASDDESRPSKAAARESESHAKSASHSSGEAVGMPKSSLMDAIGEAAKRKSPKGKNAQYDPLNGEL